MAGEAVRFTPRRGSGPRATFTAVPLALEFGRLVRPGDREARRAEAAEWARMADTSSATDLLHAVVALYDTALPETTGQSLYRTLCTEGARTLLLLRDTQEILREWELHAPAQTPSSRAESLSEINNNPLSTSKEVSPTLLEPPKSPPTEESWQHWNCPRNRRASPDSQKTRNDEPNESPFSDIFSDSNPDSDSDNSEMEQEEQGPAEDLAKGLNHFLRSVAARRAERRINMERWSLQPRHVGPEHRLVGAATCFKDYKIPGIKVVHISLLAVRRRYRKSGIGRFLLKRMKSPSMVGPYDALVVQADPASSPFFLKHGFTDDLILCSRFRDLDEKSPEHSTLLCYLPPFDGHYPLMPGVHDWNRPESLHAMQDEVDRWRQKSLEAYQAQITCLTRLQHEVVRLHNILQRQESTIQLLKRENHKLQSKLTKAEKKSTHALLEALEKEAADFERMCSFQPDLEAT